MQTTNLRPIKIDPDALYTDRNLSLVLGVSDHTITQSRRTGRLRYSKVGRTIFYRGSDIIEWLFSDGPKDE